MGLTGCASQNLPPPQPGTLLHDEHFHPPSEQIAKAEDVFALSPAMKDFLRSSPDFLRLSRTSGPRQALLDALYSRSQLKLEYDATMTRNASEAFEARSGNCLSLVIMTAAFAHELGMSVRFQSVILDETWSRSGDMFFVSGHVNLSLGATTLSNFAHSVSFEPDMMTVDFVPSEMLKGQRSLVIDEDTVVAMYMNNRAAEMLHDGRIEDAYWWARAGMLAQPRYFASYNTMAVIYRRHGDSQAAEAALREVLLREPANLQALSNLSLVLRDQGRFAEADKALAQVREMQPFPPFFFFDRGVAAMRRGDYQAARADFQKEVDRAAYYHEFHFWLALANYGLGDFNEARKHLALAEENSTTIKDHNLYAAKLSWLEAHKPAKSRMLDTHW
jgi:Flp pilus assembly protein TadD